MARVTKVEETIVRSVTLELSLEEAEVLWIITRWIGGDPSSGAPRAAMDRIGEALNDAEVRGREFDVSGYITIDRKGHQRA